MEKQKEYGHDTTTGSVYRGAALGALMIGLRPASAVQETFEVTRSEAEWRAMLTPLQYKVMREEGTERAGTSPLDKLYDAGVYHCRGCDLALYSSEHKYDSGTGWPSFWKALPNAIETNRIANCSRCARNVIVAVAEATLAIFSTMAPNRRANAIVSMG